MPKRQVNVDIEDELWVSVRLHAIRNKQTTAELVTLAIERYLGRQGLQAEEIRHNPEVETKIEEVSRAPVKPATPKNLTEDELEAANQRLMDRRAGLPREPVKFPTTIGSALDSLKAKALKSPAKRSSFDQTPEYEEEP